MAAYFSTMETNSRPQAGLPASTTPPPQSYPLHRVLVVDDDAFIRQINTRILYHSGFAVDAAEDGEAAWQALNIASYDLLVTDNDMPKLTGVELIQKLHTFRMALPVILASGTLFTDEFTRQHWLQPVAMLRKPYTAAELLETVRAVLHTTAGECEPTAPLPDWQTVGGVNTPWRNSRPGSNFVS